MIWTMPASPWCRTEPAPVARGSRARHGAAVRASLTPRKGHVVLLEALDELLDLDWHLTCVGSAERDPACAHSIAAALDRLRPAAARDVGRRAGRIGSRPVLRSGLFVLAYYGMVLAEALARGLPVISTSAGAIPDTVLDDAGLLVPAGDPQAPRRRSAR